MEVNYFEPGSSVPESLRPADEAKDMQATSSDDEEPESDNAWSDNSDSDDSDEEM